MSDSDDLSRAPGAAFAGEGMTFRKDMPHREDRRPWEFYYKHCALNGSETYFSSTSYDCAGPAY